MSMELRTRARIDQRLGEAAPYNRGSISIPSEVLRLKHPVYARNSIDVWREPMFCNGRIPFTITLIYRAFTSYRVEFGDVGWEFKSVDDTTIIEATILGFWNSEPVILIPNHEPLVNTYYIITIGRDVWAIKYEYDDVIQEGSAYSVDGKSGIATRKEGRILPTVSMIRDRFAQLAMRMSQRRKPGLRILWSKNQLPPKSLHLEKNI
ncbi:hypothetical protein BOTCAL_0321g00010 [Botryotinia calthae]|uniref:Uncharacterized protein n=1 Tax=Botryotinia calthae TaxID=38488 RepID=A0A4Y8CWC9_9HELO|nr:hypothetical protein BOTCAL_0321g00010 [Botryotinia calthae]